MRRNGMKRFISLALTAGLCLSQTLSAMAAGGANASPAVRLFRQAAKSASEIADPVTDEDYVTTWDCIEFGHYWQDANDSGLFNWDKDPVKWRVLDVGEDGVALLLSDKALGVCNYYDEDGGQKPETTDPAAMRSLEHLPGAIIRWPVR